MVNKNTVNIRYNNGKKNLLNFFISQKFIRADYFIFGANTAFNLL